MWNQWQNSVNNTPPFKRNPITFNLRSHPPPSMQNRQNELYARSPNAANVLSPRFNQQQNPSNLCRTASPYKKTNYPNVPNSQFSPAFNLRTVSNYASPSASSARSVSSTSAARSSSPIFSTSIAENTQNSDVIPFIGDNDDPVKTQSDINNKTSYKESSPVVSQSFFSNSPTCNVPSPVQSSLYDDLPELETDKRSNSPEGFMSKSEKSAEKPFYTGSISQASMCTQAVYSVSKMESSNTGATKESTGDTTGLFPFNISKVLGDAKMLNDILSVAKTIQFSEQSKSVNFPTSTSKSVAIVPPINVQSDGQNSSILTVLSTEVPDSEKSEKPTASPVISSQPFLLNRTLSNSFENNNRYSSVCESSSTISSHTNCESQFPTHQSFKSNLGVEMSENHPVSNFGMIPAEKKVIEIPFISTSPCASLESHETVPVLSTKISEGIPNRDICDSSLKRLSDDVVSYESSSKNQKLEVSDATDSQMHVVCSTEVSPPPVPPPLPPIPDDNLSVSSASSSSPSSSAAAVAASKVEWLPPPSPPESDIKLALFTELKKCTIANEKDANTVLEVISTLTEIYLKYKLRFIPAAKFQSLVQSVRQGKEKETNFILSFLKCGATAEKVSLEKKDTDTAAATETSVTSPRPVEIEKINAGPTTEETKTITAEVKPVVSETAKTADTCATTTTVESCQTPALTTMTTSLTVNAPFSNGVPQMQPFIPMYTSGNINVPVSYWMTHGMPVVHPAIVAVPHQPETALAFSPMQPPLPPPQIAPMQPPLPVQPPLPPPHRFIAPLAPPPIPLSDVPLPPPLPPQ